MYEYVIEAEFKTEDDYDQMEALLGWSAPHILLSAIDKRLFLEFESEDDRELHDWVRLVLSRDSDLKLIQAGRK